MRVPRTESVLPTCRPPVGRAQSLETNLIRPGARRRSAQCRRTSFSPGGALMIRAGTNPLQRAAPTFTCAAGFRRPARPSAERSVSGNRPGLKFQVAFNAIIFWRLLVRQSSATARQHSSGPRAEESCSKIMRFSPLRFSASAPTQAGNWRNSVRRLPDNPQRYRWIYTPAALLHK